MTLEGQQFSRYRILQLIGKGGMGEVYLAEDVEVRRQVAAKFIRIEEMQTDMGSASSVLRLFWREATTIAALDHPNILPLYDHGETTIDGFQVAYLIIPYRPEGSLTTWLRRRAQNEETRQLTLRQIAHVIQQAATALQYAHDHQVMHLDVKPANFLIRCHSVADAYPDLVLSDFGIARLVNTTSSVSQHMRGTPTYMAPEQWDNRPVFASDQYALAIMAYELLTGRPPFQGTPFSVMYAHVHEQPRSARDFNPLLPPDVDLVLQRALAKNPEARYPSVVAFAHAFQMALDSPNERTTLHVQNLVASMPSTPPLADDGKYPSEPFSFAAMTLQDPSSPSTNAFSQTTTIVTSPPEPLSIKRQRFPKVALSVVLSLLIVGGAFGFYGTVIGKWFQTSPTAIPGTIWHDHSYETTATFSCVIWSGTQFVLVGEQNFIRTSPDGLNWTTRYPDTNAIFSNVVWSGPEAKFVVIGNDGTILTSSHGDSWTTQHTGSPEDHHNIVYAAWSDSLAKFVVVGNNGFVLTSPNGITWTQSFANTSHQLWGVTWTGTQFVAVGDYGTILTSPNAINWTSRTSNTHQLVSSVARSKTLLVAVGFGGTILISRDDGRTWDFSHAATQQNLLRVIWSGTQFVAVGAHRTILTSPDGLTWTIQHTEDPQSPSFYSIAWSGQRYVAVGEKGTIFTSP